MIANMDGLKDLSSTIYYLGMGAVLFGTSVRFLVRFIARRSKDAKVIQELEAVDVKSHLGNIYIALQQIAQELNIQLHLNTPNVQLEDEWILSELPMKKRSKE